MNDILRTAPPVDAEPQRRRFSKDEFYQMLERNWFIDQRTELIDGEVLLMASQSNFHLASITLVSDALKAAFGAGYWIRIQGSLDLSPYSVPDPDVAVVPGTARGCAKANPTDALLIVEVSDSTLSFDRNRKASLYAASAIDDYWIVNLVDGQLEVRRNPVPDEEAPFGFRYADRTDLRPGAFVSPLAAPGAQILVDDLLP